MSNTCLHTLVPSITTGSMSNHANAVICAVWLLLISQQVFEVLIEGLLAGCIFFCFVLFCYVNIVPPFSQLHSPIFAPGYFCDLHTSSLETNEQTKISTLPEAVLVFFFQLLYKNLSILLPIFDSIHLQTSASRQKMMLMQAASIAF